jgi:hypothetical protein
VVPVAPEIVRFSSVMSAPESIVTIAPGVDRVRVAEPVPMTERSPPDMKNPVVDVYDPACSTT